MTDLAEMAEKVRGALERLGKPNDVLPACVLVCADQARAGGISIEQYVVSLLPTLLFVWGTEFDPAAMGKAIVDAATEHAARSGIPLDAYEQALVTAIRRGRAKRGKRS